MNRRDREQWAPARTLEDLGELTARWLEGSFSSMPGYCGAPDEETEELIPVLARLNRAGFVTTGSQPGEAGPGYEQRAAVEGFASRRVAQDIGDAADDAGLILVCASPGTLPRWRYRNDRSAAVTTVNGRDFTRFGVQLPRRHIRSPHLGYGICRRDAVKALCSAWQVTVIDPEWGRNDVLWNALDGALARGGVS